MAVIVDLSGMQIVGPSAECVRAFVAEVTGALVQAGGGGVIVDASRVRVALLEQLGTAELTQLIDRARQREQARAAGRNGRA